MSADEEKKGKAANFAVQTKAPTLSLAPRNFEELWSFAKMISETDFCPRGLQGKPGAVIAACQYGNEVGLPPMQSLRWVAVVNGAPTIWGDGALMLARSHPLCEDIDEIPSDKTEAAGKGECTITRKGRKNPITRTFTIEMAKKAGLFPGKDMSAWAKYPGRMLQMRARALCIRDAIPEALGPLSLREEAQDFIETTAVEEEPLKVPQAKKPTDSEQPLEEEPVFGQDPKSWIIDPASDEPKPPAKTKADKPTAADLLAWINNKATDDEINSNQNYLYANLKGLSTKDQTLLCARWNERRKEIVQDGQ